MSAYLNLEGRIGERRGVVGGTYNVDPLKRFPDPP